MPDIDKPWIAGLPTDDTYWEVRTARAEAEVERFRDFVRFLHAVARSKPPWMSTNVTDWLKQECEDELDDEEDGDVPRIGTEILMAEGYEHGVLDDEGHAGG